MANRDLELRILHTCIHMAAPRLGGRTCKAGVAYDSVKDTSQKPYRWPCDREGMFSGATTTCRYAAFPTPETAREEAEKWERDLAQMVEWIGTAHAAIVAATGGKRGVAGKLECPCCGEGTLAYSVSGYNGHIHAKCSRDGCVQWVE